jgi:hypothetical protein
VVIEIDNFTDQEILGLSACLGPGIQVFPTFFFKMSVNVS